MVNRRDGTYSPPVWLLNGHGGAHPLDGKELAHWQPADGPVWIDLSDDRRQDRAWLATGSGLEADDRELFLRESPWSRVSPVSPEQLFLVIRVPEPGPDRRDGTFALLRFWIEPKRVIMLRPPVLPAVQDLKKHLQTGRGPTSVDELLLFVAEFMANRLCDHVLELEDTVVDLELAIDCEDAAPYKQVRRLRRRAIELMQYANPLCAVLLRLRSLDLAWLMKAHGDGWHGLIDYIDAGTQELDAIAEHARILQESLASRTSEQMNRRIYLLTLVSTLLLPLSLVAGLFGANVSTVNGNIFGTQHPIWFIALCIALVLVGLGSYTLFRRRGFL